MSFNFEAEEMAVESFGDRPRSRGNHQIFDWKLNSTREVYFFEKNWKREEHLKTNVSN